MQGELGMRPFRSTRRFDRSWVGIRGSQVFCPFTTLFWGTGQAHLGKSVGLRGASQNAPRPWMQWFGSTAYFSSHRQRQRTQQNKRKVCSICVTLSAWHDARVWPGPENNSAGRATKPSFPRITSSAPKNRARPAQRRDHAQNSSGRSWPAEWSCLVDDSWGVHGDRSHQKKIHTKWNDKSAFFTGLPLRWAVKAKASMWPCCAALQPPSMQVLAYGPFHKAIQIRS